VKPRTESDQSTAPGQPPGAGVSSGPDTPLMRQYARIKAEHADKILLFRMGDFYEMFFEDALTASRTLDITLTSRDKGPDAVPMAGVPWHAAEGYIAKLLAAGLKVAVCDQMEPPAKGKKLVRREVTRVITPGTMIGEDLLESGRNNYLCALAPGGEGGPAGLSALDLSTGEFSCGEYAPAALADELARLGPAEVLLPAGSRAELAGALASDSASRAAVSERPSADFEPARGRGRLLAHFGVRSLEAFGVEDLPGAQAAAGAVLAYLAENRQDQLPHIRRLRARDSSGGLALDRWTVRNLELVESIRSGGARGSLLGCLDRTATPMGSRLLRSWVLWPLADRGAANARLSAVAELHGSAVMRAAVRARLGRIRDLERLAARSAARQAGPRDLLALAGGLAECPALADELAPAQDRKLAALARTLAARPGLVDRILATVDQDAPARVEAGGVVRAGADPELDRLRGLHSGGRQWMAEFEAAERRRTGIASLKVGFNDVFGFYIEVTRANLKLVPVDYARRQTLANAERFVTEELRRREAEILDAAEKIARLERGIFDGLLAEAAAGASQVQEMAGAAAELDCFAALAEAAASGGWCRPVVDDGDAIVIRDGRHPGLEAALRKGEVVPNDLELDRSARQLLVITGPNMAGKSTYIRQAALLVLMAQMGSFVPAAEARIGLVDRIFTRVGASDDISRGQSTFMVEMTETAFILNNLTRRSLVILDEVGRGTSTFDGLTTAWAVAEYLHESKERPRTLFATHFHELTELAGAFPRVANLNVAVKEWGDQIAFLHRIVPGAAPKSYGIHVARLAGLPAEAVERAREVLAVLEGREYGRGDDPIIAAKRRRRKSAVEQPSLFGAPPSPAVERLQEIDVEKLTPIEAQAELARLKQLAGKG